MGTNATNSIIDDIRKYTNSEYEPDFEMLRTSVFVAEDLAQMLLGLLLAIMYTLLTVLTLLDICYLTIPWFQDMASKKGWDRLTNHKITLISRDARDSYIQAKTVDTGRSALGIYIGKRYLTYILIVLITILIFTNYSLILNIVKNIVSGALNGIKYIFENTDVPSGMRDKINELLNNY